MDLTDEELEATRRLNGTKRKILVDVNEIEEKIEEIDKQKMWLLEKRPEGVDVDQVFAFNHGEILALKAILKGDLSEL